MSKTGKIVLLVVAAFVFAGIGFIIGQVVPAMSTLPGSTEDPLATQSYVETIVGERLVLLTTKIDELEAEIVALKGGSAPANTNSGNTTPSNTGTNTNDNNNSNSTDKLEITASGANFRKSPSTSGAKISTLPKGTVVTLVATEGDWYKVKTSDGTVGYISSSLAKKK